MPSFNLDHGVAYYVLWNAAFFAASFIPHSFMEWISHRFVLHSKAIVKLPYEEHDQTHHVQYGPDETFGVPGMDYGVDFKVRDWFLFLVFVIPFWIGVEVLTKKPLMIGTTLAALLWLHLFNVIHRHFHAPNSGWLERTWYYSVLKRHHREHHRDPRKNFNVAFFPIADFVLGTLKRGAR